MHVVLVEPEIAPNTGNIIRLCANTGCKLHLVEPLGFELDDRALKRGGLDYHELATVEVHASIDALRSAIPDHWYGFSSRARRLYTEPVFGPDAVLIFGAERGGLTGAAAAAVPDHNLLAIPMMTGNRSLNLANAVAVVVYEAWRQMNFGGAGSEATTTSETPGLSPFDS